MSSLDNRAQLSLELIIILSAIVAVVFLVAQSLISNTRTVSGNVEESTNKLLRRIKNITGG